MIVCKKTVRFDKTNKLIKNKVISKLPASVKTNMKFELKPYNVNITDEELLADLIRVAKELNKQTLTQKEYTKSQKNKFNGGTIASRLGRWNIALEKAGLKIGKVSSASDEELLQDLIRVALEISPKKLTQTIYKKEGKFSIMTISERLGWNKALTKIGLEITVQQNITEKELFQNLEEIWIKLGKQPGKRDIVKPHSKYSAGPYNNKYGTWRKALEAFVDYINSDNRQINEIEFDTVPNSNIIDKKEIGFQHKTKRDITERIKVRVLIRDGNKCRLCGVTVTGDNIHFDHIIPWSKGGETVVENIQVTCAPHNLAKGNFYEPE